ncbi:MAG: hypothetical protein J7493_12300 [Porphyrobacter sp.]|nr:hypothetical protein [Porphyrobacter sp.]
MKTIYTDKLGLYPWVMLFVSSTMFWSAYFGFTVGDGNQLGLGIGSGSLFFILGVKRLWEVREAKRQGRDPTIIRVKDSR